MTDKTSPGFKSITKTWLGGNEVRLTLPMFELAAVLIPAILKASDCSLPKPSPEMACACNLSAPPFITCCACCECFWISASLKCCQQVLVGDNRVACAWPPALLGRQLRIAFRSVFRPRLAILRHQGSSPSSVSVSAHLGLFVEVAFFPPMLPKLNRLRMSVRSRSPRPRRSSAGNKGKRLSATQIARIDRACLRDGYGFTGVSGTTEKEF
jgi:hypothetical protein